MLFSSSCRELDSLQKRYTALLHRTNTFSENKIIRSVIGRKVEGQILFGARSKKRKNLFGAKWYLRKNLFGSQRVNAPLNMYLILKNEASVKINIKLLKSERQTWTMTTLIYRYMLQDSICTCSRPCFGSILIKKLTNG